MYAVIETGGKQYRVEVGTELEVELLDVEPGKTITLDRVLLVADGAESSIGRPLVVGAAVSAEVVRQTRGEKLISFKYRPKARSRVKKGHRQELTVLRINDITLDGKSAAKAARKAQEDAKTEVQRLDEAVAARAAKDAELAARLAVGTESAARPAGATRTTPAAAKAAKAQAKAAQAEAKAAKSQPKAARVGSTPSKAQANAAKTTPSKPRPTATGSASSAETGAAPEAGKRGRARASSAETDASKPETTRRARAPKKDE